MRKTTMANSLITTTGLILKEIDYKESDKLLTVLTKDLGVIFVRARGAKRTKNKASAATGLFAYSNLSLFRMGDKFTVDSADSIDLFFGLHSDIVKISLAAYICELCSVFSPELEPAEQQLRLALNTLHLLEKDKRSPLLLKAIFELRLTSISGFLPDLTSCTNCDEENPSLGFFSPSDGTLLCGDCASIRRKDDLPLSNAALTAMRHVIYSPDEKIYNFNLSGDSQTQFFNACEKNLLYYSEKTPISLSFLKSIL